MEETNIYKMNVVCNNCDFKDEIDIEKGKAIEDKECPNCGLCELNKVQKPMRLIPRHENYR